MKQPGEYWFEFLTDEEKVKFKEKQRVQGRNTNMYLDRSFYSFHEFIVAAFRLSQPDYKYWTDLANRNVQ